MYNVPQKVDHCISKVCEGLREPEAMTMQRRQHRGEFNAKGVVEALRGARTLNDIAAD